MVKFYTTNYTYDFPLPTVSLAYFLRYPNPYSKHVVSSDVIERHFDPVTQRLYTTRLHLKRSKLPATILRLLPRSLTGPKDKNGEAQSQSYILETSTVAVKEGWMKTESQNLDWTGVLNVIERQVYTSGRENSSSASDPSQDSRRPLSPSGTTDVETTVTLRSPLGEQKWKQRKSQSTDSASSSEDEAPQKIGFFRSWGTERLQRSIEKIGLKRTERSQPNAKEGMKIVLERFRQGGLVGVLEGMRMDSLEMFAHSPTVGESATSAWRKAKSGDDGDSSDIL